MTPAPTPPDRSGHANDDFPYYNGKPVAISGAQWAFVLLMVALGFAALVAPVPLFREGWGQFIPAVAFFAIPLLGLAIVAPHHWTALFRRVGWRELLWMLAFAALNLVVSLAVGLLVMKGTGAASNPAFAILAQQGMGERSLFFLKTLPQLLGEEVLTLLPLLALTWYLHTRLGWSRSRALLLAWVATALMFGAMHLPTYGWNLLQCLVVIGSARLVLSLAYLKTKNTWVSFGAHVINDWSLFGIGLMGASAGAG